MPRLILICLLLSALSLQAQEARPRRNELDAAREALGNPSVQDPEALRKSRSQWAQHQEVITKAIEIQKAAQHSGGEKLEQCIDSYERAAQQRGTALDHYLAGRVLGLSGRLDEARKHFEQALEIDQYFFWASHGLGTCFASKDMPESAVRHYARAVEVNPAFAMAARGLALCQAKLGQHAAAEAGLRKLIEQNPRDAESLFALGSVFMDRGLYNEAAATLEEARFADATLPQIDMHLARCYLRSDQVDKALQVYEQMTRAHPDDWKAWLGIAEISQRQGRNHAAADAIEKALAHLPTGGAGDRGRLEESMQALRARPAVTVPDPQQKSLEEFIDLLLYSAEVERRREAARVLWRVEWNDRRIAQAMLHALKDKDEQVKALALQAIDREYPQENLQDLSKILALLMRDASPKVRALSAHLLGRGEHPSAVPVLMSALSEQDGYAFRLIHRALNRCTFAYIAIPEPEELDVATRLRMSTDWQSWYAKEKDRYQRYEEPKKLP